MNCELYKKKKDINGTYHVPVRDRPLISNLSPYVVEAILLLLDTEHFRIEEFISFRDFVKKIEEKKGAGVLSVLSHYHEIGIDSYAFIRACNALEYILGFSQSLGMAYPLDIFTIKFE